MNDKCFDECKLSADDVRQFISDLIDGIISRAYDSDSGDSSSSDSSSKDSAELSGEKNPRANAAQKDSNSSQKVEKSGNKEPSGDSAPSAKGESIPRSVRQSGSSDGRNVRRKVVLTYGDKSGYGLY